MKTLCERKTNGITIGDKMKYKYINSQTPREKINYSYSTYGGENFLEAWKESRKKINSKKHFSRDVLNLKSNSSTEILLVKWIKQFEHDEFSDFNKLDLLLKRFEVTKRLYSEYDVDFRRINKNDFEELKLYVLFSYILTLAYEKSCKLPYLNSLLKINDINLSNAENLQEEERILLGYCIHVEMEFIQKLRDKLG